MEHIFAIFPKLTGIYKKNRQFLKKVPPSYRSATFRYLINSFAVVKYRSIIYLLSKARAISNSKYIGFALSSINYYR